MLIIVNRTTPYVHLLSATGGRVSAVLCLLLTTFVKIFRSSYSIIRNSFLLKQFFNFAEALSLGFRNKKEHKDEPKKVYSSKEPGFEKVLFII